MTSTDLLSQVQAVQAAPAKERQGKKKSCSVYDLGPAEPVMELIRPREAWIVECKYDSNVLVTRGNSALPMVDIDHCNPLGVVDPVLDMHWMEMTLGESELNLQIRVYETAHGFRLLVENQLLTPSGKVFRVLAKAFDCDPSYLKLCQSQECYRARLTPRPEATYGARVCKYFGTIGSAGISEDLAPLIQLHDERTGALLESGELG